VTDHEADEATEYGDFPLRRYLGMEMLDAARETGRARVELGEQHQNPNGVTHGAVLFAIVDTAMGQATMSVLDEGQFCASVDVQVRFIRPVSDGAIEAEATVLKRGRNVVHLEATIVDERSRLIATAAGTFTIVAIPSLDG
jgi:acyl-CoA thioesterase